MAAFKKIKICYVTSVDVTIKFILFNQINFLKKEGYDVHAVCSSGKWVKGLRDDGIKIKTIRFRRKFFSPISDLSAFVKLFFYFKKEKFDIVHTHTPKPSLIGQLAAKMAGVPIIVNTIHGLYFQKNDSWLKRNLFILTEKIAAKCSDLIFFVNKEDMETAVKEKICSCDLERYFGGGVSIERFNPRRFSPGFVAKKKAELGISKNHKVVGITARLVKEKGYLDLFSAFKKLLENFPETTLLVAGPEEPEKKDGINPDIVKKYQIEKNVVFLGDRTDIDEIYAVMDIFVLPTYREGLGISIIEASAMEKPVVATNIRGCIEAVDDGKTGILAPLKNPDELAKAIKFLFRNSEKAIEMGKMGRLKAVREFDERLVFDRIKKEYERLILEKNI